LLHDVGAARIDAGLRDKYQYRYDALPRIEHFQGKFDQAKAYVRVLSIENFGFFSVEDMFLAELEKLRKRIDVQWTKQRKLAQAGHESSRGSESRRQ